MKTQSDTIPYRTERALLRFYGKIPNRRKLIRDIKSHRLTWKKNEYGIGNAIGYGKIQHVELCRILGIQDPSRSNKLCWQKELPVVAGFWFWKHAKAPERKGFIIDLIEVQFQDGEPWQNFPPQSKSVFPYPWQKMDKPTRNSATRYAGPIKPPESD